MARTRKPGLRACALYQHELWPVLFLSPRETRTCIGEFFEALTCALLKQYGARRASVGNTRRSGDNWDIRLHDGAWVECKAAGSGRACWAFSAEQAAALRASVGAGQKGFVVFWRYKAGRHITKTCKNLEKLYTVLCASIEYFAIVSFTQLVPLLLAGKQYSYGRNMYVEVKQADVLGLAGRFASPRTVGAQRVGKIRVPDVAGYDVAGLVRFAG